jgi:hypothetical protein
MNSKILDFADYTLNLVYYIGGQVYSEDYKKVEAAKAELEAAIANLKNLDWNYLFAIEDEKRKELTVCQQKFAECYAKLKRVLLETYKEIFDAVKKF